MILRFSVGKCSIPTQQVWLEGLGYCHGIASAPQAPTHAKKSQEVPWKTMTGFLLLFLPACAGDIFPAHGHGQRCRASTGS